MPSVQWNREGGSGLMPTTDYSKIPNTLERRATMIVEMLNDKAQHIVDALDEPPPGTQEPSTDQVRDMWTFSPFGDRQR